MRVIYTICLILCWSQGLLQAQYFGQNKPSYESFNFELYKTPHFELYHYLQNEKLTVQLAEQAEKWYYYHQQVLLDTFKIRSPILFYSNHADFQQTTAIGSRIDVGTGGLTEGMKRRVVMPIAFTRQQTDHVLGHELVHAFQYHMLSTDDELNLVAISNVPLWMIEGMAEYLSLGSIHCQTALWMRDGLINNNFPSLEAMTGSYRYSPYRYGHAFWAYIAHKYGEQYISRIFMATARNGYKKALEDVLMITPDTFSSQWQNALENHLIQSVNDTTFSIIGDRLLSKQNSGRYNLNPSISPDGQKLIYLSERDLYAIDLFMADPTTGEIISRLYTATSHDEIDALNYLETAGSWSPDSQYFSFIAFKQGQAVCLIFDIKKKQISHEIVVPHYDELSWPAWSPNGKTIAFSALKEGISDIIIYNTETKRTKNLTQNHYSCIQPSWSTDGTYLVYATDQPAHSGHQNDTGLNIARLSADGSHQQTYATFNGANNLNPLVTTHNNDILFLSNWDGRRNLYLFNTEDESIHQITNYPTGIIGMTEYSPALTITADTLCYTMLWDGEYSIYKTKLSYIQKNKTPVHNRIPVDLASRLLPYSPIPSQVETNLYFRKQPYALKQDSFYTDEIVNKFKLDYIGNASAGVMTGRFGMGMAGSIEAMFSDILGRNMLFTALSVNGEIYDFGGQVAYMSQKNRIKIGIGLSHIPYRTGTYQQQTDSLPDGSTSKTLNYLYRRTFEDKLSFFTFIPINKTRRFEIGASYALYNYRIERVNNIKSYSQINTGEKEKLPSPDGFGTGIFDVAFVIDNAKMGLASPVEGKRLRIQFEHYLHKLQMQTLLIDFRRYFFVKPYSLAFRIYHYGRYGHDSDNERLSELFLGSPWFMRGYDMGHAYGDEAVNESSISLNQMIGTRLVVTNIEWRIPFTGPREVAAIPSSFLFSELAMFIDGGLTWTKNNHPTASLTTNSHSKRIPVFSGGMAYRINLFGAMVLEPYYAYPFHQNRFKKGNFGINLFAGW